MVIKKEWLDPGLGAFRKNIKYVLSSVLLHQSKTTGGSHFMAAVKSQDGSWILTDDAHLRTYKSFEEMAGTRTIRQTASIFAYRRLPLVTRGPEITLKKSLQTAKYSDPEATEENEKLEIDLAPAQTDGIMDIDAFGTTPANATKFVPLPKLPINVAQHNDETEIELDEKQRGTLEVKFTTDTGVTTLKVHVKGMLWNELKDKFQARRSTGGRPVTKSAVTLKQASDVVPTKPVKMNTKAAIGRRLLRSWSMGRRDGWRRPRLAVLVGSLRRLFRRRVW